MQAAKLPKARAQRRERTKRYYQRNRERELKRRQNPAYKAERRRQNRTPEGRIAKNAKEAKYRETHRESVTAYRRKYERAHRAKKLARLLASLMRRFGYLKPEPCAVCGSQDVLIHHRDYAHPLDIAWLCRTHHVLEHHPLP